MLQNSNIFNRSREPAFVMPFGDEKVTHFSGFPPTSVSYLKLAYVVLHMTVKQFLVHMNLVELENLP